MLQKILSFFLPREDRFYRLLEELSGQARDSAFHLKTFVETRDEQARKAASDAIEASKAGAKKTLSRITEELCFTFVTPFDREDIQDFSVDLYKITKTIDKVRERLTLHNLSSEKGDFSRQIDLIVQEATAMEAMVKALISKSSDHKIAEQAKLLHDLEQKGDEVLGDLLTTLFRDTSDARSLILRKDIYDMLEKVVDRYRDAAGVALQIVLKHS